MTAVTDPSPTVYVVLILAALIWGGVALRYPKRMTRIVAAVWIALLILIFAIDFFVESPREQSVRKVSAMVDAMNARNSDALLAHASESFDYKGQKKSRLGSVELWNVLRSQNVRVSVWDFSRDDVQMPDDTTTVIGFMAKGEGGGRQVPMYIRATFVRDPDGQWRVRTFATYDPLQKARGSELTIPGLP